MPSAKENSKTDFFYSLSVNKQHLIALSILFLVPFFLFTASTLGGKEFQRHDITQWRAGSESAIDYRETYGKETLWVTNMYLGMPAYTISVKTAVKHIDYFAQYFKFIYPSLQFWVMLSGMYVLLILLGFKPLVAVFGSITFSLTTYFPIIIVAGHTSKFVALTYIPWIFVGYWKLTRGKNKLLGLLLFTVAMALEVRAGHPQITYYFMYLLGLLWVTDSWQQIRSKEYKQFGILTGLLIFGGIVGILGHAQSFLTLQEYAPFSIRGGSVLEGTTGLDTNYAFAWSQGIKETLTLFVPEIFGGASPNYFGPKSFTSGPHYLGALVLPFLVLALLKIRDKSMYVFFATGTLGIIFSWGSNFILINQLAFDYLPLFDKFRAPETWLVLTSFCYTIVAVYGLDWFFKFIKEKSLAKKDLYVPVGVTALIFVFLFVQVKSSDFIGPNEVDLLSQQVAQQNQVGPDNPQVRQRAISYIQQNFVPEREAKANSDIMRLGLFLLFGLGLLWLSLRNRISIGIASIGLIFLAGFDMISVGKRYIPERTFIDKNIDLVQQIESKKRDIDEFIVNNINSDNGVYPYRVFPLIVNTFQDAIPSYFYPTIGGYAGAKLSIISELQQNNGPIYKGDSGLNLDLLGALNIKYINYQQGLRIPGLTQVFAGNSGAVFENEKLLPKAFFVDSLVITEQAQEAYEFIDRANIDFSKIAVVETSNEITTISDSTSFVEITRYTGSEISLNIKRIEPGFMVLSEIYYPKGWVAKLNGKEIPIYKTNYVLRGFEIPEGEHTLEVEFIPQSYYLGVTLGWISLSIQALLALVFAFNYYTNRKS